MRTLLFTITLLSLLGCSKKHANVYLFSYFQGNGEDGLHLAASEDGLRWTPLNNNESFLAPQVGEDKLMRDPCIIRGKDNLFHMVWTVSWNEQGIGYANSPDLIHWSEQRYISVMHHEPDARNCWAPELFFDAESDQYLICWATTIPGRFPETDSLGDDGYNHRMYYTTTQDFHEFSETKLLYNKGFNVIDATILKTDQSYMMFLKNETLKPEPQKNIRIATSTELTGNYSEASEAITSNWVEGPTLTKIDDAWILYFDMYTKHQMGAVTSTDLTNWTDISDQIHFPEGTRHGTVFTVEEQVLNKLKHMSQ